VRLQDVAAGRTVRFESIRNCPIETDPALVGRAVSGLLRNALEATLPGGTVELTCEYDHETATITVHNEGVIPDDVQKQIFQRSFSTSGEGGRGLGTYSAKLVVEHYLGGKLAFMSEPRVGTLFLVMLPRRMEARKAA
jgi:signal transduction histidine kinase